MNDYVNVRQLGNGCLSGRISEWPSLRTEARKCTEELDELRTTLARLRAELDAANKRAEEAEKVAKAARSHDHVNLIDDHDEPHSVLCSAIAAYDAARKGASPCLT